MIRQKIDNSIIYNQFTISEKSILFIIILNSKISIYLSINDKISENLFFSISDNHKEL